MDPRGRIRIGLLHSLTGTMSVSEPALLDAERMAIDEVNDEGGVLGCLVEPVVADGASEPSTFAERARALQDDGVRYLFGCWTSASRKAVKQVLEEAGGLLWYPVQYEGLEQSRSVVYVGSCLNQQVTPAVEWALQNLGSRIFLIGSDYVFPRTANTMIRSLVESRGADASIAGEMVVPLGHQDFTEALRRIVNSEATVVLNTLNGDSNLGFLRQYASTLQRRVPLLSVSVGETELRSMAALAVDHYACWSYFESLGTPENRRFVARSKLRFGAAHVCSAPSTTAYCAVLLWREAIRAAGTLEVDEVRQRLAGCAVVGPAGRLEIQPNGHVPLSAHVGRLRTDGQFEILWSSAAPIPPLPWLGVEERELPNERMIIEAMAGYPDAVHTAWLLRREVERRERAEVTLRAVLDDLERRVGERTTELVASNTRLAREVAERERAQRIRDEFLSVAAHELKTPTTSVAGFAQLLLRDLDRGKVPDPPRLEHGLRVIHHQATRLARLVAQLLDVSRLDGGRLVIEPAAEVDLVPIVESVVEAARVRAARRVIELTSPGRLLVRGDELRLEQVLTNLVDNAIKFSPEGGTVAVELAEEPGFARIVVSDRGIGIAPADLDRVFERFAQVEPDSRLGGLGLGLYISREIVRLHGGAIRAEPRPGGGSQFVIELPRR